MRYPAMTVNREKVLKNARAAAALCEEFGIEAWGVTKGLSGDPRLADIYCEAGFAGIADSRLRNLEKIRNAGVAAPLQLMRVAMRSELEDLVRWSDVSLQSEISTIIAIDEICARVGATHDVLLMMDMGDLREGFLPGDLPPALPMLKDLKGGVRICGVATNFACASGVLPTPENMAKLVSCRDMASDALGTEMPVVSVGGTCCLKIIEERAAPKEVNQLRICEGILLGTDTAFDREIPYLAQDAITITAEIVECRLKPSVPEGETGLQAFGEKPVFADRGTRKRALLGMGRQDVNIDRITPMERGVHIVTASSDHLIVDVTDADSARPPDGGCKPGDTLRFRPLYPAMLACSTSEYVDLVFE